MAATLVPENTAAERALLGAFLTEPMRFREIEGLSADHFSLSSHRVLYRAMATLDEDSKPIEPVLLCELLQSRGDLQTVGGAPYITGLFDGCLPESVYEYAAIVKKQARRRRLVNALETAKCNALDGRTPEQVMAELQDAFSDPGGHSETLGHSYSEIVNAPPVTFAIDGFLQENGITLIGGLSGHGKTLIMLAMVRALLEGGKLFHRFAVATPAKKVIYLIPECGLGPFAHRLKTFHLADYVREDRLIVRTLSRKPICLDDPLLLRAAPGADIFLDTAVRFKEGDENDAGENNEFADRLFNLQRVGARTITGAHHAPKSFANEKIMTLENILRGTGDIGAMLCTCWGVRQIDDEQNRIFVQNVKPRDFQPCKPFIIQGRPSIDATGYFELTEPPGFARELADQLKKVGRPAIDAEKIVQAQQMHAEGKSFREIAATLGVSRGTVGNYLTSSKKVQ